VRGRLAALFVLAAACDVEPRAGPGLAGGPLPPIAARPSGRALTLGIGPAGDSLTFVGTSGSLTLTVPPGAVAAVMDFTIDELTPNTAVGGLGSAFRVGPANAPLLAPVTLTFTPVDPVQVPLVAASHQIDLGYWFRSYNVTRTASGVSTLTASLGDWTLVTLATARDLHGPFHLDSTTQDVPFSADGTVTLQYIGEEPGFVYYIPVGTIAVSAAGCDPVPASDLPLSIAEIRTSPAPANFRWGLNGQWTLSCGAAHPFITAGFDTMGIDNIRCGLSYSGTYVIDPAHLRGQFVVDCGVRGQVVAAWELVPPAQAPGPLPPP
jgi:hypothetical protein